MDQSKVAPDLHAEIRALAWGVRAISLGFILTLSVFNLRLAFQIGNFRQIFADMLGGKPLPVFTEFVLRMEPAFIGAALILPIVAILITLAVRNNKIALGVLASIMFLIFVQMNLTWSALMAPLFGIVQALGTPSP